MLQNELKKKLLAGEAVVGTIPQTDSPLHLNVLAESDFDFILIDTQHSQIDVSMLGRMITILKPSKYIIVRAIFNHTHLINQVLDAGADGVIIPLTDTAEEVEKAVQAAKYPPRGIRSWGPKGALYYGGPVEYAQIANDEVIVLPQVESQTAVDNLDEILSIDGVDGIMIGPADLGLTLGVLPHEGKEVRDAAIQKVLDKCIEHGKPWGMFTSTLESAPQWLTRGGQIATVGTEVGFTQDGIEATLKGVRSLRDQVNSK